MQQSNFWKVDACRIYGWVSETFGIRDWTQHLSVISSHLSLFLRVDQSPYLLPQTGLPWVAEAWPLRVWQPYHKERMCFFQPSKTNIVPRKASGWPLLGHMAIAAVRIFPRRRAERLIAQIQLAITVHYKCEIYSFSHSAQLYQVILGCKEPQVSPISW